MASNGLALAPWSTANPHTQSSSSRLPATTPSDTSLWPPIALVAEWTTRSAPYSSGRWPSGGRERGVHDLHRPGDRTEALEVDEVQPRVGGRLCQQEHRPARAHRRLPRLGVGAVHEGHLHPEAGADRLQQHLRAGVELVLAHDVVALRAQAEHDRSDRAHARAERPRRLGTLELGDGLLEGVDRRVAVAAVEGAGSGRGRHGTPLLHRSRDEGGAGPHHRRQGGAVRAAAAADEHRLGCVPPCTGVGLVAHRTSSRNVHMAGVNWPVSIRNPSWPWGESMSTHVLGAPDAPSSSCSRRCWDGG